MMDPSYWWGHGFGFMWIFPLIFIIVMAFFMRNMMGRGGGGGPKSPSAREILDQRFAKGEISKQEYEEMKQTLNG